ncbi:hypothetical protein HIM_01107 [Hirsutella minnesotensis 3608]|nr:hypothetical protein HIM_01107 [Hirsutella minnesotensis 3608]
MPDSNLNSFTSVFRATDAGRIKRNRSALSCMACQRRKSKCDRRQPCGACERRGGSVACQYGGEGGRKEVQLRLSRLEEMVKGLAKAKTAQQKTATGDGLDLQHATTLTAIHQDGTHDEAGEDYHGATSWTALIDSIRGIRSLLSTAGEEQDTMEFKAGGEGPDLLFGDSSSLSMDDVLASLPTRQESDRLVSTYFNAKFLAVPFLHTHQFRRLYEGFWAEPASVSFLWISILFSVLAAGASIARIKDPALAERPSVAEPPAYLARAAQCLVTGGYLKAGRWSVEAVLLYAHCRTLERADADSALWSVYGLVVRLAQRRGYHRDPTRIGVAVSPFEAEMRRRAWFIIQSSDLLMSMQHGMPPLVDDASRLCRIMRRVVRLALSTTPQTHAQTRDLHAALEQWHQALPACLRIRPIRDTAFTDANHTIMQRLMLEIMYLKALCVLHRPYLVGPAADAHLALGPGQDDAESRLRASREVCRRAARRLLELHIDVDAETAPGRRMYEDRYMMTSMTYDHFLLAAMVLCLDLSESVDHSPDDRASLVQMLRAIHAIWSARSAASADARHASRVLSAILGRVDGAPSPSSRSDLPTLAPHSPASSQNPGAHASSRYDVELGETPFLDGLLDGPEGVDWVSIDHFLRAEQSISAPFPDGMSYPLPNLSLTPGSTSSYPSHML